MNGTRDEGRPARVSVEWFRSWEPRIAAVLSQLPDSDGCPHELYASLLERACSDDAQIAVVRRDEPIALIGLRRGESAWYPLTNWLTPGFVGACRPGELITALTALRRPVDVAWWEMGQLPDHPHIRSFRPTPVHRLRTSEREAYWRASKQWQNVTRARRKCEHLEVCVNRPGDAAWVIESSDAKWRMDDRPSPEVADRIEIVDYLQARGRHVTIVLRDGDTPLAGCSSVIHDGVSMPGVLYRDDSVGGLPTGVRVFDALFEWAEEEGVEFVDVGGGFEYKTKWAPEVGAHHQLAIVPPAQHLRNRAVHVARALARRGMARLPARSSADRADAGPIGSGPGNGDR